MKMKVTWMKTPQITYQVHLYVSKYKKNEEVILSFVSGVQLL